MRKLKITEGVAKISSQHEKGILITTINPLCDVATVWGYGSVVEEKANADLVVDAFNTANKCDMLPSELANKYENLLQNISRTIADLVVEKEKQLFIIGNDSDLDKIRVATEQKIGLNFAISYLNDMLEFDKNN